MEKPILFFEEFIGHLTKEHCVFDEGQTFGGDPTGSLSLLSGSPFDVDIWKTFAADNEA